MYAKIENSAIIKYPKIPSQLRTDQGWVLGLDKQPDNVKAEYGFYPVVSSEYNPKTHRRTTELKFDSNTKKFTYVLVEIAYDLEDVRQEKLEELYNAMDAIQQAGRRYFTMKRDKGEAIPATIEQGKNALYARFDQLKSYLDSETDVMKLVNWEVPQSEVDAAIKQQKSLK